MVRLTYGEDKKPLWIQTPEMYIPFDVQHHDDASSNQNQNHAADGNNSGGNAAMSSTNFTFEVAMQGYNDPESRMQTFYEKIKALDAFIVNTCVERSAEWLGEKKGKEVVSEFYRNLARQKNEKYSPLMKIKVAKLRADGTLPVIFDAKNGNEVLDISSIAKGVRAKFIIAFQSVWFVNKTFGVTAKLIQASVTHRPASSTVNQYAFVDDEEQTVANKATSSSSPSSSTNASNTDMLLEEDDLQF